MAADRLWPRATTPRRSVASWASPRPPITGGATSSGGLKPGDANRLKDLERENATLKRLLADAELEKDALREIAGENF